jgi:hypothetical protein
MISIGSQGETHQHDIYPAAHIARGRADQRTDEAGADSAQQPDRERDTAGAQQAAQRVATGVVGAEPMFE